MEDIRLLLIVLLTKLDTLSMVVKSSLPGLRYSSLGQGTHLPVSCTWVIVHKVESSKEQEPVDVALVKVSCSP